jgi:tRNA A37 threonylcarbamoyltransferase TsaD
LEAACREAGLELRLAGRAFCTDNAGMVGVVAERRLSLGRANSDLDEEPLPSWALDDLDGA